MRIIARGAPGTKSTGEATNWWDHGKKKEPSRGMVIGCIGYIISFTHAWMKIASRYLVPRSLHLVAAILLSCDCLLSSCEM